MTIGRRSPRRLPPLLFDTLDVAHHARDESVVGGVFLAGEVEQEVERVAHASPPITG